LPCGLIKEFHDGRTWIGVHLANTLLAVTYQPVKGMSMSSSKIVTAWRVIPILACVMYLIVGPAAMVVNNDIMNSLHFPYPLTISALGVGSSALVARIAALLGLAQIRDQTAKFLCSSQWCRCILPLGASYAVTLATGNAVYLVLGIGFIQMLKAAAPIFVLLATVLLGLEEPSMGTIFCVCLISLGTIITTATAPEWNLPGLCLMFAACAAEAVRLALTQYLLTSCKMSVLEGQHIVAPVGAFFLFATAAVLEFPRIFFSGAIGTVLANPFTFSTAILLAIGVNYSTYFVIQTTGSLTLKVIGTLRNMGLICFGVMFRGEVLVAKQLIGYAVALFGFIGYNYCSSKAAIIAKAK